MRVNYFCIVILFSFISCIAHAQFVLDKHPDINALSDIDVEKLCQVASKTHQYLTQFSDDSFAVHQGKNLSSQITLERVKNTLEFLCRVANEDKNLANSNKLKNNDFLRENFEFHRWLPDKNQADSWAKQRPNTVKKRLVNNIPEDKIFLTKYYTKLLDASAVRTEKYDQALYSLPFDEVELTLEQAELSKQKLTRFRYTRQEVIEGVLLTNKLAKPLIWLTEEALHDVLLQGTGVVEVKGKRRYFNVHRNNGIAYDYTIGKREQARYWYFSEVPSIMGYGKTLNSKIAISPNVSFAGNVADLGLGKLFLVNYQNNKTKQQENQLGILADQGGAFDNNLFQLDWLKGSYRGWKDYYQANKHLPDYVNAWLLLVKEKQ
jgi:hypothetical protein